MSKEYSDQNSSESLNNKEDSIPDLYQTIEFTDEDKKRLRHSNRQPLDQDYFAKSNPINTPSSEKDASNHELEEETETKEEEHSNESLNNEFRYHSIHEREITTEKKEETETTVGKKKSKIFNDLFKPTYEEHYDLDELEDISSYNQFEKAEKPDKEASVFSSIKNFFKRNNDADGSPDDTESMDDDTVTEDEFIERYDVSLDDAHKENSEGEERDKTSFLQSFKSVFFGEDKEEYEAPDEAATETVKSEEPALEESTVTSEIKAEKQDAVSDIPEELEESGNRDDKESEEVIAAVPLGNDDEKENLPEEEGLDLTSASTEIIEEETVDTLHENITDNDEVSDYTEEEITEISERISQQTGSFKIPIQTDLAIEETVKPDTRSEEDLSVQEKDTSHTDKSKLVSGASWLTAGSIISRIVGALYVIPWATWLGESYTQANSLYSIGYKPYSLFLAIATAGFPSSIAKQMAYYHSMKEYKVADKLFKNSTLIMLGTGVVSAALLFLIAPFLAEQSATTNVVGATLVIRSLSPALLILPLMSLLRGYFQGFNDMKPTAISQIIEQFARVGYLLAATYAIMMIYNGEVTQAVMHSTFAAFIGSLASLLYLVVIYLRHLPLIKGLIKSSANRIDVDFKESIKIMVVDSIPFILLGSGIIIAQLIDTYSFGQILERTSSLLLSEIEQLYGTLSLDVDKLVMIIISLAVALASSLVPVLTGYFAKRDIKGTSSLVEHIIVLFSFIMIPAAFGMAAISNNIYFLFYPYGLSIGPRLLVTASLSSIILGLYTVLSTILQSMNFRRLAVRFLVMGLFIKLVLQFPLVALFHAHGALLSTMLGFLVSSVLMWIKINRELTIDYRTMNTRLIKIAVGSILMGISAVMWNEALNIAFGEVGRFLTFIKILVVILMAFLVYGSIMALTNMLPLILGDKHKDLQEKMRIME